MPTKKNNAYPTAVVTELALGSLSIIRSLGKRGVPVIGIDHNTTNFGVYSKYCRPVFCENVNSDPLVQTLLDLAKTLDQKAVILCNTDQSALVVSRYREELQDYYTFVLPSHEVLETLINKKMFHEFAVKHKLPVPHTIFTHSKEEAEAAADVIPFPCVIKPQLRTSSWYELIYPLHKVIFISSKSEYFEVINNYDIASQALIIQECIQGKDEDIYFCLTYIDRDLQPLATFSGKTIRLHPVRTGLYAAAESFFEPFVVKETLRILSLAGCKGPCSVEFMFCHKDMTFKITEPTAGRIDMQESMATACGIDIPYISYQDAIGVKQKLSENFRQGVKWLCETEEIYAFRQCLGNSGLKKLVSSYSGKRAYGLFDVDDPLPFLKFFSTVIKRKARKFIKRTAH